MAVCPKCSRRKAKRYCPALRTEICAPCCAENRLKTIPCPQDCPHLGGELYQHRRRQEKAVAHGKEFIGLQERLFPERLSREYAMRLQADIYYFARENGAVDDATVSEVLESLKSSLSKIYVPSSSPPPLLRFLQERIESKRYQFSSALTDDARRRTIGALASHVRSLAKQAAAPASHEGAPAGNGSSGAGSGRFHGMLAAFFDELDFEADLNYSPHDEEEGGESGPTERRSPSGLILPPGM